MIEVEAAATAWSAASSRMGGPGPTIFFDHQSARAGEEGASILMGSPSVWLREVEGRFIEGPSGAVVDDPIAWMKAHHRQIFYDGDLPFVGGLAGYLGFEFGWLLDDVNAPLRRARAPLLWVGLFPAAAIFDHLRGVWQVVGESPDVEELARWLSEAPAEPDLGDMEATSERFDAVDEADYRNRVQDAVDCIYDGEFFEVNYTERFRGRWSVDRRLLYHRLRQGAPGAFGGIVDIPEVFVGSVSPEQFLSVDENRRVMTRPIKGTRPRGATPDEDARLGRQLAVSEKDRAENVMIVDLMRNDLTKISEPGSVRATNLCELHSFASVHHLISTVEGRLAQPFCALDAFLACFPAGSITGAPKLRAMEWIAENEDSPRGPYTGSLFYWSRHGRLDSNVLIRTAVLVGDDVRYGAGGAVVADSDPAGEYEEALWKARPFFDALESE